MKGGRGCGEPFYLGNGKGFERHTGTIRSEAGIKNRKQVKGEGRGTIEKKHTILNCPEHTEN